MNLDTYPFPIVLFDGHCNLCDASVRFIIARDPDAVFRFAPAHSAVGLALSKHYGIDPIEEGSVVLIATKKVFLRSDAALEIVRYLQRPWRWLFVLRFLPRPLRDTLYALIARNRYRWFGKKTACSLLDPSLADRFLDAP